MIHTPRDRHTNPSLSINPPLTSNTTSRCARVISPRRHIPTSTFRGRDAHKTSPPLLLSSSVEGAAVME